MKGRFVVPTQEQAAVHASMHINQNQSKYLEHFRRLAVEVGCRVRGAQRRVAGHVDALILAPGQEVLVTEVGVRLHLWTR